MKKMFAAALLSAFCAISTSASATSVAMNGAFDTANMSNNHYGAVFSGKSFLPEKYAVNGLSFSFSFVDAGGTFTDSAAVQDSYQATGYGYHSHDWRSVTFARYVDVKQTVTRSSEQETAQLMFGNILLGSGATTLSERKIDGGSTFKRVNDAAYCLAIWCKYFDSKITTRTSIVQQDYTGGFTISGIISDQSIIDQLLASGELTFNLNIGGKLKLTDSSVLLDYTRVDEPAEVPEPSGVLLVAAGLAGLGLARRRRSAVSA